MEGEGVLESSGRTRIHCQMLQNSAGEQYDAALASGKFELRLLVGSKAAGAVIGKGGDNIKKLRANVRIFISISFCIIVKFRVF